MVNYIIHLFFYHSSCRRDQFTVIILKIWYDTTAYHGKPGGGGAVKVSPEQAPV